MTLYQENVIFKAENYDQEIRMDMSSVIITSGIVFGYAF